MDHFFFYLHCLLLASGYTVYHRGHGSTWQEQPVGGTGGGHVWLGGLGCSTEVHVYATAWNALGT